MEEIYLVVGGLTIRIKGEKEYINLFRKNQYKHFLGDNTNDTDFYLEVIFSDVEKQNHVLLNNVSKLKWRGSDFYYKTSENENLFKIHVVDIDLNFIGTNLLVIDSRYTKGRLLVSVFNSETYAQHELMVIMSSLLSKNQGVLLHCAGIKMHNLNSCMVFSGESGRGKSTISKLFAKQKNQFCVLNDDRIIIRMLNNTPICFGTPWYSSSELNYNDKGILTSVFFIEHAKKNFHDQKCFGEAYKNMIANIFYFPAWNEDFTRDTLSVIKKIVKSVKTNRLGFLPNDSIVRYISNFVSEMNVASVE